MKTKRFYCKIFLLLFAVGLLPQANVLAQQYQKSKSVTKVFPVTTESSVQIINKYGNVHILPWGKDSIRFDIEIKVESTKQSRVEKTYDNISIESSESAYYIIVQTVFGNQKNAFWADVTDFANSMLKGGSNAQIDYTVYLPASIELTIENKFGNIYMTDHKGKVNVTISNGDFRGGKFRHLDLDHGFGNVVIDSIKSGNMTLSYTEMKLNYGEDLIINSKSSKPNIKSFGSLQLDSKRDTYHFEKAGMINAETSFSYLTVEDIRGDLILNCNYGNLSVDGFSPGFSMLNMVARYTDVNLICNEGFSYYLEVYHDDKTTMIYPKSPPVFMEEKTEQDDGKSILSGHYGSNADDIPRMKINIEGGSVNIIQQ